MSGCVLRSYPDPSVVPVSPWTSMVVEGQSSSAGTVECCLSSTSGRFLFHPALPVTRTPATEVAQFNARG